MSLNWKALAPHRPLDPGEAGYVVSPSGFAERIARLVTTGTSTVLVGGPVGVGKSTELARITALLQGPRAACLVQLDRHENIRRLTADQLLLRLAGQLVEYAIESLRLNVSSSLAEPLLASGVLSPRIAPAIAPGFLAFQSSPEALVNAALEEVTRRSRQGRVTLLIDGLEKMPESTQAHEILAALGGLDESVDLVIVVPWFVAFGSSEDAIRPGALFAPVPAPPVEGPEGRTGRQFLADVLTTRLGLPREVLGAAEKAALTQTSGDVRPGRAMVLEAARWSGGLPRTFLQLMADAAQYDQIRRGSGWPSDVDLADAVADQKDSFRRALLPGDSDALREVDGTDGREMELSRKVRLLARGVLLERHHGNGWVMDIHPLVRPLLGKTDHA